VAERAAGLARERFLANTIATRGGLVKKREKYFSPSGATSARSPDERGVMTPVLRKAGSEYTDWEF
jgi:predicted secreted Zn-dependent protease